MPTLSSRPTDVHNSRDRVSAGNFVVHDPLVSGHYDAALPFEKSPSQRAMTTGCSCGVNSDDKSRKSCTPLPHYNSRCKCYKQSQPCLTTCRCKNCANPHGKKEVLPKKCKRTTHSLQVQLPSSKGLQRTEGNV